MADPAPLGILMSLLCDQYQPWSVRFKWWKSSHRDEGRRDGDLQLCRNLKGRFVSTLFIELAYMSIGYVEYYGSKVLE